MILIGNLASDPEHQITKTGKPVCTFRLAVQRRFTNAQGVREADFFTVVAWGKLADLAARYLTKGRKAAVTGWLQTRSYDTQDGTKRHITEVVADEVEFLSSAKSEEQSQEQTGFTQVDDDEMPF